MSCGVMRRDAEHQPIPVKDVALNLPASAWRKVTWREGAAAPLSSRFARVRVRAAHRDYKLSTERRTSIDYAQVLKELSDLHFPKAEKIVLVQDNLNTHNPASLYEAFTALEARRLVERFERHYTPKHGGWLNMAESELAIPSNQCLDRRIPDRRSLKRQVAAWLLDRNTHNVKANWRFTAGDARIKLKSLYPAL